MTALKQIFCLAILILFSNHINSQTDHQSNNKDHLDGHNYPDKTTPDDSPVIFSQGIISGDLIAHSYPAFSPDHKMVYWSAYKDNFRDQKIFFMINSDNGWTEPDISPFSGKYHDSNPALSPDGMKLYFFSNRPSGIKGQEEKSDIWMMDKTDNGWGDPKPLGLGKYFKILYAGLSVTNSGNLFIAGEKEKDKGISNIYRSENIGGKFMKPKILDKEINSSGYKEFAPFVSPDMRYIIFSSMDRPDSFGSADLYISFRNNDGSWEKALNMGTIVNSPELECWPSLSPDSQYLFFVSDRDGKDKIYWMDASIINHLKGPGQ